MVDRLLQEVNRPQLQAFHGRANRARARDDDDRHPQAPCPQVAEQFDPAHPRHLQVQHEAVARTRAPVPAQVVQ